jgi:hypothetical protein
MNLKRYRKGNRKVAFFSGSFGVMLPGRAAAGMLNQARKSALLRITANFHKTVRTNIGYGT